MKMIKFDVTLRRQLKCTFVALALSFNTQAGIWDYFSFDWLSSDESTTRPSPSNEQPFVMPDDLVTPANRPVPRPDSVYRWLPRHKERRSQNQ